MAEGVLDRLRNGLVRTVKQSVDIVCLNAILTSSTVELSSSASDDSMKFTDAERIDKELMAYLTSRKAINWCGNTCKLVPLANDTTSGNGLLRAVSSSIWGLQDEATDSFLRRLLHVALTSGEQKSAFKERWELEKEKANSSSDRQQHSKYAWEEVCRAFQGTELQQKKDIPLDAIHIFSLSNVLRRPIVILSDVSTTFSRAPDTDLTGIYLPLLSSAESCVPYPLLFVRSDGLFRALVVNRVRLEWFQMQKFRSVPLVRVDQEPFDLRCLLTSEQSRQVRELLMSYLTIVEITYRTTTGQFQVLTSRLSTEKPIFGSPKSEDVFANVTQVQRKHFPERCLEVDEVPIGGKDEGSVETDPSSIDGGAGCVRNCIACQAIRRTERKKLTNEGSPPPESNALSALRTDPTRCENIRCKNKGSLKYGGRCYACYVMKDESLEVYDEDEKLRYFEATNRKESPIFQLGEKTQEMMVEDTVSELRKAVDTNDAIVDKDKVAVADVKDTRKPVKVEDAYGSAKVKHRSGSVDVKDELESEDIKDKHEYEDIKDKQKPEDMKNKQKSAAMKDEIEAEKVIDSTTSKDVLVSLKVNEISNVNKLRESKTVTQNVNPIDCVKVSDTPQPFTEQTAPPTDSSITCSVDQTDTGSTPTTVTKILKMEHPTPDASGFRVRSRRRQKCLVDFCNNSAETIYRGLCRSCYQTLVLHRNPRDTEEETATSASSTTESGIRCLMEDCQEPVTNKQLGLCLPCLRTQIFAARELERRKELRRNLLKPSEKPSQKAKAYPENIDSSDDRCSGYNKRRISKSSSDVNAAIELNTTPQRSRASPLNKSTKRITAKYCLTPDCDRFGDPSFDGFCSLCFGKHTLVPRN